MDRDYLVGTFADAYVWGYPTVDGHSVMCKQALDPGSPEFRAPFNRIAHAHELATPSDRSIVAMNVDTPYSYLWLDLRAEPIVVSVPSFEPGRYVAMQLFDLYTYIVGYVSPRTNGNAGGNFLIAGPDWEGEVPDGIDGVFRVPTQLAFSLFRTQLFDSDDMPNVCRIQDGYRVRALSTYGRISVPPVAEPIVDIAPIDIRKDTQSLRFFSVLNAVLAYMPPLEEERDLRARFTQAGIEAGVVFAPDDDEVASAALEGMKIGLERLHERAKTVRSSAEIFGSRDYLGDDYLSRAVGALLGIFGNAKEEYLGVGYQTDSGGRPFNGSRRYEIRFEADGMPPVDAFWSITVYTVEKFLYANEIGRYVVNSPMVPKLLKDTDGSLTLYVQHEPPADEQVANWLPVPAGDFGLTFRCYQPREPIICGSWQAPPVVRMEGASS